MSHKCRDNIGVRKGGVEKLGVGLSLSRPLAVNIGVSSVVKIALGGKMSGGGSKVVVVSRDNSAVSVGDQLGVSIGGPLAVHSVGVSSVVRVALSGEVSGSGSGISGVVGGDGAIRVVHKGVSLGGPLAVHSVRVSSIVRIALGGEVSGGGGGISGVVGGDGAIRVVDKLTSSHSH